jgi:hypothetical protein
MFVVVGRALDFVSGVLVCYSSLDWCLILRGVGVDLAVLVSISVYVLQSY